MNLQKKQLLSRVEELPEGSTLKFQFEQEGIQREGFVAHVQGRFVAYENVCRHLPLSLDYADNRFFTPDGRNFICQTHGAVYDPLTGVCLEGPCPGTKLKRLELEIENGQIWLRKLPAAPAEFFHPCRKT